MACLSFHLSRDRFLVIVPRNSARRFGRLGGMAFQARSHVSFTHSSESSLEYRMFQAIL